MGERDGSFADVAPLGLGARAVKPVDEVSIAPERRDEEHAARPRTAAGGGGGGRQPRRMLARLAVGDAAGVEEGQPSLVLANQDCHRPVALDRDRDVVRATPRGSREERVARPGALMYFPRLSRAQGSSRIQVSILAHAL